jgi:hypothetical protein
MMQLLWLLPTQLKSDPWAQANLNVEQCLPSYGPCGRCFKGGRARKVLTWANYYLQGILLTTYGVDQQDFS